MKQAVPWVFALLASITSVTLHVDAQGVRVELKRTQHQLAAVQDQFELATAQDLYLEPASCAPN
jgi:hypothetical protein